MPQPRTYSQETFEWKLYPEEDTGLPLVTLTDSQTGIMVATPLPRIDKRVAAHSAWAGARHSRMPGDTIEILREMGEKGVDPDEKLEETFRNYGHASVGDMARGAGLDVHFNNVPMTIPLALFNAGEINSGQEKSTRYQSEFGKAFLHGLENYLPQSDRFEEFSEAYQFLGREALKMFRGNKNRLRELFTASYKPEGKDQTDTLVMRVLDTARSFLLAGMSTGFSYETSARDWGRKIAALKASQTELYRRVGTQLEAILAPSTDIEKTLGFKAQSPSLIRHTEPDKTVRGNLEELAEYIATNFPAVHGDVASSSFHSSRPQEVRFIPQEASPAERMVAQYFASILPDAEPTKLFSFIRNMPDLHKRKISDIIFGGHSRHKELPQLARTTGLGYIVTTGLGEVRDLNRQRGHGRFIQGFPLINGIPLTANTAERILSSGFHLPLYLTEMPEFSELRTSFEADLQEYYENLHIFAEKVGREYGESADHSFVTNLLPLAHSTRLWMHGDPKQAHYVGDLRVRPGGHINYRVIAYDINQIVSSSDPYLSGMAMSPEQRPDPANREEFFSRA